jgi:hypothetical protein
VSNQHYLITKYHVRHYPKLVASDIEYCPRAINEIRLSKNFLLGTSRDEIKGNPPATRKLPAMGIPIRH